MRELLFKNKSLLIFFLILIFSLYDRTLWSNISQWQVDEASTMWISLKYPFFEIPVGLISSENIPNPNGMIYFSKLLNKFPSLWLSSYFLSLFLVAKLYKNISTSIILTGFLFGILVVFYFMKYDIPWTYYILGSVLANLLIIFILQNLNHSLVNKFGFIALILSLIPLFYGEKEISSKTQIISLPIKNNCKLDIDRRLQRLLP